MTHRIATRLPMILMALAASYHLLSCAASPRSSSVPRSGTAPAPAPPSVIEADDPALWATVGRSTPDPLAASPVIWLDVRAPDEHSAARVPGSLRVDYKEWTDLSLAQATGLDHEAAWQARLAAMGITPDHAVYIYDNGAMTRAARVWFIVQHFGVRSAAVINGGFPQIQQAAQRGMVVIASGPPTDLAAPRGTAAGVAAFAAASEAHAPVPLIDRAALRHAIDRGEVQVLDARTAAEFTGIDSRGNPRAGHMPGAINLPHAELLDPDNRLRPPAELRAMLARAGIRPGRPIVTHCQGGGRAALAALAATRAGYGPVMNYYLSFGDWSADATCPVISAEE